VRYIASYYFSDNLASTLTNQADERLPESVNSKYQQVFFQIKSKYRHCMVDPSTGFIGLQNRQVLIIDNAMHIIKTGETATKLYDVLKKLRRHFLIKDM